MSQANELTLDQINWLNVSGNREVKRLPSHFTVVIHTFGYVEPGPQLGWAAVQATISTFWDNTWDSPKPLSKLRIYLDRTFSGRYYIGYNSTGYRSAVCQSQTLVVGFEDPAEASFFGLQIDHLIKRIETELQQKK